MSRIHTPATIDASPAAAQPLLEAVNKQLGVVPNLFRVIANDPIGVSPQVVTKAQTAIHAGGSDAVMREDIATTT